jgi:hypothetical protein
VFSGKIQVSGGKICHSCCTTCTPPTCLHIAVYDEGMVLAVEADLILVPGDDRADLVWEIDETAEYPWQRHWVSWNREVGTYGFWAFTVDYKLNDYTHITYGVTTGEGSYCDGLAGTFEGFYTQTVVISPCTELLTFASPLQSTRKTGCSNCRGLA